VANDHRQIYEDSPNWDRGRIRLLGELYAYYTVKLANLSKIRLTGNDIPLTTQSISMDHAFTTNDVIQPSLQPFLPTIQGDSWLPNTDSPLLTLRLTTLLPSRRSVLGITWSHILGDAATCHAFITLLSKLYVGGPDLQLQPGDYPNFGPHVDFPIYPPQKEVVDRYDIPQTRPRSMSEMKEAFSRDGASSQMVVISLSRKEMAEMKKECQAVTQDRLSDQDILSGWWIWLLERLGETIERVVYAINVSTGSYHFRCRLTRSVSRATYRPCFIPLNSGRTKRQRCAATSY
jgi:hypothetical protein